MINLQNVEKTYHTGKISFKALDKVNISISKGDFVSITGKSGCGKTTLLNIIGCVDSFTGGSYFFDNNDIFKIKTSSLARFRNRNIGYIFQSFYLIPELNVIDNVGMPLGYAGVKGSRIKEKSLQALEQVGLADKRKSYPANLSGGQQQRVAIARAIVTNPQIILADEPTGNLDEENSQVITDLLIQLHKNGATLVLVTHDVQMARLAQRQIVLSDGRVVQ
jgi:ABC-type lipoprotein export system ATPase subunit